MELRIYQPHTEESFEAEKLLDCPCCGGEAELLFIGNSYTKKRSVTIKCTKCYIQRKDSTLRHTSEWIARASIRDWNSRVSK